MILPISIYGSPILRAENVDIDKTCPDVKKLIDDMFATMQAAEGVGLAAPQVGRNIRLFVVDLTSWADDDPSVAGFRRAFINPEIYWSSEETGLYNEGCLSLPGLHEDVSRPLVIRMRYLDENFVPHDEEFDGRPARVIQHEYDHLEGIVFTDRLSPLRRTLLKSKLVGFTKGKYKASYRTKS
ncbi:MAG: peptide deformylase [Alistipes sp.]|jgi:peptide deformylase|nr:peptide deformylase [Alistipes sp.]